MNIDLIPMLNKRINLNDKKINLKRQNFFLKDTTYILL